MAGEIGKPHGISGEVYVVPISDDPRRWQPNARLIHDSGRSLVVAGSRPHRNRLLVKFEGVDSRPEAENLRGALYVRPNDLRDLESDEFWEHDLTGCEVRTIDGTVVGTVSRVLKAPAQDLLVVATPGGERLVPVVKEIVVKVDVADRCITIDPPEGLLE